MFVKIIRPFIRAAVDLTGEQYEIQRWGLRFMARYHIPPPQAVLQDVQLGRLRAKSFSWMDPGRPRTILFLHGGGFAVGSPIIYHQLCLRLARASDARVLLGAYRQAPEHIFPAAQDDALELYRGALERGVDPARLIVMGDSAGGNLAAGLLQRARDHGLPPPAAAVLLSPWLDLTLRHESIDANRRLDPLLSRNNLRCFVDWHLDGQDPSHPLASPVWGDLSNLPPVLIQVGSDEVLLDESRTYARRAWKAGADVELEVWKDMIHIWHLMASFAPQGKRAIRRIGEFCKKHVS